MMSPRSPSERLADLQYDARLLVEQAGDQEASLEALVAAAERDMRYSEAAQSYSPDLGTHEVFEDSPTRTLLAAVLSKPATPGAVLATVQRVAGL
jgi:hypothetical protein